MCVCVFVKAKVRPVSHNKTMTLIKGSHLVVKMKLKGRLRECEDELPSIVQKNINNKLKYRKKIYISGQWCLKH